MSIISIIHTPAKYQFSVTLASTLDAEYLADTEDHDLCSVAAITIGLHHSAWTKGTR